MTRRWVAYAGLILLLAVWGGPLPQLAETTFAAHMLLHVVVVAVAPPLIALGLAGTRYDPVRSGSVIFSPFPASLVEVLVVWMWHLPVPHQAALNSGWLFGLEQVSYLCAGLLVWLAAFGQPHDTHRTAGGVAALLFTSTHMTLLGVLIATSPRPLYEHLGISGLPPLVDQQIGGIIMLSGAGLSYLAGGLFLLARLLYHQPVRERQ